MSRAELVETFAGYPAQLGRAVGEAEAAGRRPSAGEWGPAEIVRHLIAVEGEVWRSRLAQLAAGEDPYWSWTEPGLAPGFDDVPVGRIVAAFAEARAATAATVRSLDDDGWAHFGTHATYGRLDVAGLLRIAIDHDADHLRGLEPG